MKEPTHVCKKCKCECDVLLCGSEEISNLSKCCQCKVDTFGAVEYSDDHFCPAKDKPI